MKESLLLTNQSCKRAEGLTTRGSVSEWDTYTGCMTLSYGREDVPTGGIAVINNHLLVSSGRRSQLKCHQLGLLDESGNKTQTIQCMDPISVITASNHSGFLALAFDTSVQLWEISSGWKSEAVSGHYQTVNLLLFSSDDRYLVSTGADSVIVVWDVCCILNRLTRGIKPKHSIQVTDIGSCIVDMVAISACLPELIIAATLDSNASLINVHTGKVDCTINVEGKAKCVRATPTLSEIFFGCMNGSVMVTYRSDLMQFKLDKSKELSIVHCSAIHLMAISLDGNRLATASIDGMVCLWDTCTLECRNVLTHLGQISNLRFVNYRPSTNMELMNSPLFQDRPTESKEDQNSWVVAKEIPFSCFKVKTCLADFIGVKNDTRQTDKYRQMANELQKCRQTNINLMRKFSEMVSDGGVSK